MEYELRIEKLTYGRDGLGHRPDGKVIFVPGTVPGDLVKVVEVSETTGYVRAQVIDLLEPSVNRRDVACSSYPVCGGCSWMQVKRGFQLLVKQEFAQNAKDRLTAASNCLGFVKVHKIVYTQEEFFYRQRVSFHVRVVGGTVKIGMFKAGTHEIVPVRFCPICLDGLNKVLGACYQERIGRFGDFEATLELSQGHDGKVLATFFLAKPILRPKHLAQTILSMDQVAGVAICFPRRRKVCLGKVTSKVEVIDGVTVPVSHGAFLQPNRFVNPLLVREVVRVFKEHDVDGTILELYAGHGNFTIPLARAGFRLVACEIGVDLTLVKALHDNVKFYRADATSFLRKYRVGHDYRAVLLNPPRSGARTAVAEIARLKFPFVVYVSCNPATFVRDGKTLLQEGYRLAELLPFDMLPQTYHLELVGVFIR